MKSHHHPILVAGPCSAESPSQLMKVAEGLRDSRVDYYRAGLWKPRTRPGSFEGVGSLGLTWLTDVKKAYGYRVITEVATPEQAALAIEAGLDAVWIGARTTVNPFYIQEIAEACKGVEVPIFVKNPINPDLKLWLGAIERFEGLTASSVHAIHRGFNAYYDAGYRNPPRWTIPIRLKQARPDIKLLCDPSHIAGRRDMIAEICQQALDLQFDGFMIETHHDPDHAWTDARQQVTPRMLTNIMNALHLRSEHADSRQALTQLSDLRSQIDDIDGQLLELFRRRHQHSATIGRLKAVHDITVLQPERWKDVLERAHQIGASLELPGHFIDALFQIIHEGSINEQIEVMRDQDDLTSGSAAASISMK